MPQNFFSRKTKAEKVAKPEKSKSNAHQADVDLKNLYAESSSSDELEKKKKEGSRQPPDFHLTINSESETKEKTEFEDLNSIGESYKDETKVQRGNLKEEVVETSKIYKDFKACLESLDSIKKNKQVLSGNSSILASFDKTATITRMDNYSPGEVHAYDVGKLKILGKQLLGSLQTFIVLQNFPIEVDGEIDNEKLHRVLVEYSDEKEQEQTKIKLQGNKLHRSSGLPANTNISATYMQGTGKEIFVMGRKGNIHMASHKLGKFHHSSLLAGSDVAFAGEIKVVNGEIKWLSNKSGHYKPTESQLLSFLRHLQNMGISLDFALEINVRSELGNLVPKSFGAAREYLTELEKKQVKNLEPEN